MDSNGFSSPRTDCFPAGLRVLVVDDDPTWLKILEKMLKKCNYEVTTCNLAREALDLLRERKDGFHIVISDVNMPDMDGFKLLEHVGLEMDLPVIMMSVDGETSRVMKGVQHGACDYLLKPIRMKELRNIWQHVYRKRIHEGRDIEGHESLEDIQMMRSGMDLLDDGYLFSGDLISGKKRKEVDNKHDDRVFGDASSGKKARVVWTVDLHQKFVRAVNQIGFEKAGPKKILDLMGVPWLTRENVASHLQKYRLYLTRLQEENELKATFSSTKHSDISSKDLVGSVCLQNSTTKSAPTAQPSISANESYSGHKILTHNDEPKICEGSVNAVLGDTADLAKSSTSRVSFDHSFRPLDSDVKSEAKIQAQYSWSAGVPIPFKQDHKPHFHSEQRFDQLPVPIHRVHVGSLENSPAHNSGKSTKEPNKPTQAALKPVHSKNTTDKSIEKVTEVETTAGLFSVQSESHLTDYHATDHVPCSIWNTKNHSLGNNIYDDLESSRRNLVVGTGSALSLWESDFDDYSPQVELCQPNTFLVNIDALGYNNQELIADIPPHLYDCLKFDSEYLSDTVEYPVINQGLYIA